MNLFSLKNHHQPEDQLFSEDEAQNPASDPKQNSFLEIVRFSIIALLIVMPIRMFIAQPFIVSGASMQETFQNGEYLVVDQISYHLHEPERGDVIIFRYPRDTSKYFIKRIIALPHDTIMIEGSKVTIINEEHPEGIILDEPYIKSMSMGTKLTQTLGEDEYFVMGDNRDESSDSRIWGILKEEHIIGKAFLRLFPPQQFSVMPGAAPMDLTNGEPNN